MSDILAGIVEYSGYISLLKFLLVLAPFFIWLPLVNWIYRDTEAVGTNGILWTSLVIFAGGGGFLAWLVIPVYLIGFLIFLIILGGVSMAYIIHRNALVSEFDKVLTPEHIRNIFVDANKKMEKASLGLSFTTAFGNDVPIPEPKSRESTGFILTCEILHDALWRRVSQISFVPQKDKYDVIYVIDGVPGKQESKDREEMDIFIYYTKQLAGLEVDEKRKPQKGRFSVTEDDEHKTPVHWEVNTAGSTAGEQVKLTRVTSAIAQKIEELGFNENQIESVKTLKDLTAGLVIVSGPAKSGLTTTLYTLLGCHDPFMNNINTLEKEPSSELQNITQNVYTLSDTGTTTYSRKLQSVLRRGPDIIGISHCDDAQCAKLASAAAKDGRMVYILMEADSVIKTVEQWMKLMGDRTLVSETLTAVINQRLVRKLCEECRVAYKPNPALFKKFNLSASEVDMLYRPGEIEYDKRGNPIVCECCQGTGYYGRTGLFETIRITDEVRKIIRTSDSINDISTTFRRAGMLYMQEQSIKKVASGITSINEVIRNFSKKA